MHPVRARQLGLPTAMVMLGALAACRSSPEVREFAGSYATEAAPIGVTRDFTLTAAPATITLLDGRPLEVWAYNAQVPGPVLRVRLGETVRATFTNRLPQPTTIHWHGERVPNAMDGVPGVTQPPVQPGETFVYEFTPKDAGTFWFHPHLRSSEQIERGLFGVLIVVEDQKPPPYSQDVLWVLDDWLLTPEGHIFPQFNTRHDLAHDDRWGNVVTVNGHTREQLVIKPGERIRLRLLEHGIRNNRGHRSCCYGNGTSMERVDTLVVDKTGTLTEGKPRVMEVLALAGDGESEVLRLAASLERGSEHPLAASIVTAAQERQLDLAEVKNFQSLTGKGCGDPSAGTDLLSAIGSCSRSSTFDSGQEDDRVRALRAAGHTVMFLARDARLIGLIGVADPIKESIPEAIGALHRERIRIVMLTGDNRTTAEAVASKLALDEVEAG